MPRLDLKVMGVSETGQIMMLQAVAASLSLRFVRPFPYPTGSGIPLFLAPMAGVSESPFRQLCRSSGADVVVTEFLSAEAIRRENPATVAKLRFGPEERPIGVQIFGADPTRWAMPRRS